MMLSLMMACRSPQDSENCHYSIKLKNNTNKVFYLYAVDSILPLSDIRTDPFFKPMSAFAGNDGIEMGRIRFVGGGRPTCIEEVMQNKKYLHIYLLDSASLANKNWDEIRHNNLIERKIKVTIDELRKSNFTIDYNGKK